MKKEMSLTQQTLKAVSAMIDNIDRQRHQAQATAVKLEKIASQRSLIRYVICIQNSAFDQRKTDSEPTPEKFPKIVWNCLKI
jgi:TATA-box binding protein (TBP) (component of TFIID and TFIIIB)